MNLVLFDHELDRAMQSDLLLPSSAVVSKDLCKSSPFPRRQICPLCYGKGRRTPKQLGNEDWKFRSGRVILRYLYAVYTRDKII